MAGSSTEWMPLVACAREVGISAKALQRNIENGTVRVRSLRLTPRTTRVHRADWVEWIQANTVNAGAANSA